MNTGWLSGAGEFIKADEYNHYKIASELVEHFNYYYDFNNHPDATLLKFGWVQLSISRPSNKYHIYFEGHLTDYQKKWINHKLETDTEFIVDSLYLQLFMDECK